MMGGREGRKEEDRKDRQPEGLSFHESIVTFSVRVGVAAVAAGMDGCSDGRVSGDRLYWGGWLDKLIDGCMDGWMDG